MDTLTLKELKRIVKLFENHEEDMDSTDTKIYEKICIIIEDLEDVSEDHEAIKTDYDEENLDHNEEDKETLYYEQFDEDN